MAALLKVVIADSSPLYRQGIEQALHAAGVELCAFAADSWQELEAILHCRDDLDLLLLDSGVNGLRQYAQLDALLQQYEVPALVLCETVNSDSVRSLFQAGARGISLRSLDGRKLFEAVRCILQGDFWRPELDKYHWMQASEKVSLQSGLEQLSAKEKCVLMHLKDGLMNKQIARQMQVTENTIKGHVSNIYRKLNVDNRIRLAMSMQQLEAAGTLRVA
ncbi:response regulator transcription factor [Marinobacterium jannaschii]|uniref:response regulator transcription factor n=1 Tax=Marinobacterium jannaschii TaxID=64970 RepID=UPI000488AC64|nr:response regulator transcription factor [Marinobacterium jannaschii]